MAICAQSAADDSTLGPWALGILANLATALLIYYAAARFAFNDIEDWRVARRRRIVVSRIPNGFRVALSNDDGEVCDNVQVVWFDQKGVRRRVALPGSMDLEVPKSLVTDIEALKPQKIQEMYLTYALASGNEFSHQLLRRGKTYRRLTRYYEPGTWGPLAFLRPHIHRLFEHRRYPRRRTNFMGRTMFSVLIIFIVYAIFTDPEGWNPNAWHEIWSWIKGLGN